VEVSAEDAEIAFTNKGARLISWRLRKYKDEKGHGEEMVPAAASVKPLDVDTGDEKTDARIREALFQATPTSLTVGKGHEAVLRFAYAGGDLEVEKLLRFEGTGYLANVSVTVRRGGQLMPVRLVWGPGLGNPTAGEAAVRGYQPPHGVVRAAASVTRRQTDKLQTPETFNGADWVGIESRYFAALMVPPGGHGTGMLKAVSLPPLPGHDEAATSAALAEVELGTSTAPALVYVGPKDYMMLSHLGHGLVDVVPVGEWIGRIVVLFMRLLRWVHGYVGNYGWAIVVITVLINLAMAPLRHYSIANGQKMAKLAPELKVIQERYRGIPALDKRREQMQREMSAVYEKHGMNMSTQMLVGCLPILLTLPFLIAIYRVIDVSVELRGAPFLWIPDLSQKDPWFITPLLMGLTMFLTQRLTPSAMDPAQQKAMLVMPIFLMVMFVAAPAGLNLYWLASNVCSIAQQAVTLRLLQVERPAPAKAERRKR
jgi:YidC/Oxa1 family membrane protein insertase